MSLQKIIEQNFLEALRKQDVAVVETLRLLKSEITKKEKEGKGLTEEMVVQVVKSQIKQRRESIIEYQKGGREDLANKERQELDIIEKYLPAQMSAEAIKEIINKVALELAEAEKRDFGKVMGRVMSELKGEADGTLVSKLVKELLEANK